MSCSASALDAAATAGRALAVGDFDGDEKPDLARLMAGEAPALEVRLAAGGCERRRAGGAERLGRARASMRGPARRRPRQRRQARPPGLRAERTVLWLGKGDGTLRRRDRSALGRRQGRDAAAVLDYDIEGDLDLALAGGAAARELFRNALEGPRRRSQPSARRPSLRSPGNVRDLARQRPRPRRRPRPPRSPTPAASPGSTTCARAASPTAPPPRASPAPARPSLAVASADLDNDGLPRPRRAPAAGGLACWRNQGGALRALGRSPRPARRAAASPRRRRRRPRQRRPARPRRRRRPAVVVALAAPTAPASAPLAARPAAPAGAAALAAADLDGDGDLDLVAAGPAGLHRLDNQGGNKNHWLTVRLRGLDQGEQQEQRPGPRLGRRGARRRRLPVPRGRRRRHPLRPRQPAPRPTCCASSGPTACRRTACSRARDQRIVEEQLLKGSCPFLYAWDGERIGLRHRPALGRAASACRWPTASGPAPTPTSWCGWTARVPSDGVYRLRDHRGAVGGRLLRPRAALGGGPPGGRRGGEQPARPPRPPPARRGARRAATCARSPPPGTAPGATSPPRVARARRGLRRRLRRERLPGGRRARPGPSPSTSARRPAAPVRLHLDGWIFPADASLNLAVAQRADSRAVCRRAWRSRPPPAGRSLMPEMGFPAGKTKTMVVDTPPLPAGSPPPAHRHLALARLGPHRLDDRARPTTRRGSSPASHPARAELRFRGFSRLVRSAPNAPARLRLRGRRGGLPLAPLPRPLHPLRRRARAARRRRRPLRRPGPRRRDRPRPSTPPRLPPPPAGWRRTVFLESHGWDKDADRNTYEAAQVEPLPFRAMSGYPYGPGERFPDTPLHREYLERWLTREVK